MHGRGRFPLSYVEVLGGAPWRAEPITALAVVNYELHHTPTKHYVRHLCPYTERDRATEAHMLGRVHVQVYMVEVKRGSQTYRVSYRYSIWRDLYVRLRKRFPRHRFPRFPERILFGPQPRPPHAPIRMLTYIHICTCMHMCAHSLCMACPDGRGGLGRNLSPTVPQARLLGMHRFFQVRRPYPHHTEID